jgi:hypothetical protein
MRTSILKIALTLLVSLIGIQQGLGQQKGSLFLGLGPDITTEKEYDKGEFDVNVLPFDIQYYLNKTIAIKASTVINLHVGDDTQISQLGGQLSIPIYFLSGSSSPVSGIYLAPVLGLSHNQISKGNEITAAAEAGYTWITPSGFTMDLGLQLGGTYFTANDETAGWRNHSGIKFRLGYTFKNGKKTI